MDKKKPNKKDLLKNTIKLDLSGSGLSEKEKYMFDDYLKSLRNFKKLARRFDKLDVYFSVASK